LVNGILSSYLVNEYYFASKEEFGVMFTYTAGIVLLGVMFTYTAGIVQFCLELCSHTLQV